MYYTDDPVADFHRHDAECEAQLDKLPVCCQCGEPIQQDDAVYINDEYICDRCLDDLRVDLLWKDGDFDGG